jgi:hypothetical protein
MICFV